MRTLLATAALLALSAGPVLAQNATTAPATPSPAATGTPTTGSTMSKPLDPADQRFFHDAATGGMAEVQGGQYMAQNGHSEQVKAFGQKMVDDHTAANNKLLQVAQSLGLTMPTTLDRDQQQMSERLHKMKGAALDRAYMRDMVADHQKDIQLFQREAQSGQNPELKNFAAQTLPTLQQHLQLAESIERNTTSHEASSAR